MQNRGYPHSGIASFVYRQYSNQSEQASALVLKVLPFEIPSQNEQTGPTQNNPSATH
jgi:hypothetical protein